jgi:energy-coupling factor transporter ATP-binding protein EcfA2
MITILEGPDGAGKSTLANALAAVISGRKNERFVITKHGPYPDENEIASIYMSDIITGTLATVAPLHKWHAIMDRSWISEEVYGPIARGKNRIDVARRRALERAALAGGAVVVLCLPRYAMCERAYLTRKELEYLPSTAKLTEVYEEFTRRWLYRRQEALPWVLYDYEKHGVGSIIDEIERVRIVNRGPGAGAFREGNTLLVGEKLSQSTAASHLPFVSWDRGGCVAWLSDQFEEWGLREDALYWVNAFDSNNKALDPHPWVDELAPRKIVVLGIAAATWARNNDLHKRFNVHYADHPQFHKRFRNKEHYDLKELLS